MRRVRLLLFCETKKNQLFNPLGDWNSVCSKAIQIRFTKEKRTAKWIQYVFISKLRQFLFWGLKMKTAID